MKSKKKVKSKSKDKLDQSSALKKAVRLLAADLEALQKRVDKLEEDTSPHRNSPATSSTDV